MVNFEALGRCIACPIQKEISRQEKINRRLLSRVSRDILNLQESIFYAQFPQASRVDFESINAAEYPGVILGLGDSESSCARSYVSGLQEKKQHLAENRIPELCETIFGLSEFSYEVKTQCEKGPRVLDLGFVAVLQCTSARIPLRDKIGHTELIIPY